MRLARWAGLLLVAAPFLTGCAAFWAALPSSTSSGCTTSCSTLSSGYFYILNAPSSGTPQVVGEQIVAGTLTAVTGGTLTAPAVPYAMALTPSGSYLYLSTAAGVYVYPVSSGALGTAAQVSSDESALAIQVDTTGQWLIEAVQASTSGSITMAAVPLNTSNGQDNGAEKTATLTIANAAVQPGKMVISSDDKNIFVALGAGGTIIVPFNSSAASGTSPFGSSAYTVPVANSGGSAFSVAVDPTLRLFYIGETLADTAGTSGGLRAFEYSSIGGTLVQAAGSPIASGGLAPNAILPATSGSQIYVANGAGTTSAGNITTFNLTSGSGAYTIAAAGTHAAAGIQPFSLAKDANGNFLLAISELGDPYFSSYTFDTTTTGKLDAQLTATTGTAPLAVVAAP